MYRNENNLYINRVNLNLHDFIRNINLIPDKDNICLLNCSDNYITGNLYCIPFPNLKKLYLQNNCISSIENMLPDKLEYLCIDNNNIIELPELPRNLKFLSFSGNNILKLPVLPNSLKRLKLNIETIDITQQSYECKKSIIFLLNKRKFKHNFNSLQITHLNQFKLRERDNNHFAEAIMYDKINLCNHNNNNKTFHILRTLFIFISCFL
jgi:Leucine-rich repeat (LRR) protein